MPAPPPAGQTAHHEVFELDLMPVAPAPSIEPPEPPAPPSAPSQAAQAGPDAPVLAALHRLLDAVVGLRAGR